MHHVPLVRLNGTTPAPRSMGGLVAADGTTPLTTLQSITRAKPVSAAPTPLEPTGTGSATAVEPKASSDLRWLLIVVVTLGALVIAAIGFTGSYSAVRDLAARKGFGGFAPYFPIGIDAGIVVLLALDLLLTWLRIGFPLLRQTAWLLTAATVAFNAAAAWPDPLGVGMHAVIPVLFIVAVEAARHAVGRVADITADRHMEGVRASRWLLAPMATFRLWRRMKLWELRSYETAVAHEQDRAVYQAQLRTRYGRSWKRSAPEHALAPLRLTRYGVPLADAIARTRTPDAPEPGSTPDAPSAAASRMAQDASRASASRKPNDRNRRARPRPQPDAGKPTTADGRRTRLRELAAAGNAPASIRQAAEVLGCRQSTAKQLLAAEGLLSTHPTRK